MLEHLLAYVKFLIANAIIEITKTKL